MIGKHFLKIWSGVLSSLTLVATERATNAQVINVDNDKSDKEITIKESNKTDLFLKHAKEIYSDSMLFAGHSSHRSHASHRSHYSSRSGQSEAPVSPPSSTTSTTPSTETVPSYPNKPSETIKKLDIGNIKMIQVSLNLLGYDAGKVDGKTADSFRTAINKFQTDENITASGEVDGKTCLLLSRKIKEKFPDDANAKELHNNLLRLYLQMYAQ